MAEKKRTSHAQKAASAAKQKSAGKKTDTAKGKGKGSKPSAGEPVKESRFPLRFITSVVFLGFFALFLAIFLETDGMIPNFMASLTLGLVGYVGFVVAIPGFLYLFFIHAFSGNRPVIMRSICVGCFILACGCLAHLSSDLVLLSKGMKILNELYINGTNGLGGGVICGLLTGALRGLCGYGLSFVLLILAAVFTLLGAMQITIPSIIRAIHNRPRADWEEKDRAPQQEPAAIVVNHLANKRIAYVENKRSKPHREPAPESPKVLPPAPQTQPESSGHPSGHRDPDKTSELFRQIEADTEKPVVAAGEPQEQPAPVEEAMLPEPQEQPSAPEAAAPAAQPEPPRSLPEKDAEPIKAVTLETGIPETMPHLDLAAKKPAPQVVKPKKLPPKEPEPVQEDISRELQQGLEEPPVQYCYPPIELLKNSALSGVDGTAEMRENSKRLNDTLASFKIEAHIINVTRGPSVTRYEVELEKGVRLSKLTTAADDIALSLGASGVRIAAVPGKISVVGIEVPNKAVTTVSLREVIDSPEFSRAKSRSSFAVGKDIGGNCIVGNIAKLPHMLIAGTTGSGKSVCMNSIIISLLYKASPDEVKLIMVDPKMVELGIYNGIPHLLIPVVTDPKKAAGSLQWAVSEMMRRYKAMSDAGVRDLESYNSIVQCEDGARLPQVVVIIDELADLMLVAAKEVEESICRIAQMGRAAGIHLIIATQRPSADVITGLMKANIPSRIAFAVASAMESRIILDTQGAEKLVGKGDMLYAPIGNGKPRRVQGCFVTDQEVEAVATYVKNHYTTTYDQQVIEEIDKKAAQSGSRNQSAQADPEPSAEEMEGDEMLPAAVDIILETKQASVSMLQRRLKLGYARAARIVDEMEEKGIVGPHQGSKPREILITKDQWEATRGGVQLGFEDLQEDPFDPEAEEAE